jgi:hypothetical protein
MVEGDARRALALALDEIARGVSGATIDAEMGSMCRQSFFQLLHEGSPVTQEAIEEASQRFADLTARLMPPGLVRRFVEQACSMRLLPEGRYADLVPGFTSSEEIAGADADARRASPLQKFTQQELLDCLAWNDREPRIVVAVAHLIQLVATYVEGLRHLVARHSPEAATKLVAFARQWAPKNVLKFLNVALFVTGRRREGGGPFTVDQALIGEAMDLLSHAGAFRWEVQADVSVGPAAVTRIQCPAHRFLHLLLVNEGALMTVVDFVAAEASREPVPPALVEHLELVRRRAISEATGIGTFGQAWSQMKLDA